MLTALDQLARVEARVEATAGFDAGFDALRVEYHGRRAEFFWACCRLLTVRQALTRAQVPSATHLSKYQYVVPRGGKSPGTSRQTHSFLSTYKMALTISTSCHLLCRLTSSSG